MDLRSSGNRTLPDILADPRFRQAFSELLTGVDYAGMTSGNRWDFAVEIDVLRSLGLSDNDLRLLVQRRFVEHAREVTTLRTKGRKFRPMGELIFAGRTCFVLTPLGIAKASSQNRSSLVRAPKSVFSLAQSRNHQKQQFLPIWDTARRQLTYRGQLVRTFKRRAMNQELILTAFQEENWPKRIDDPLTPRPCLEGYGRLHDTIKCLNRGLVVELLHFCGDGTGKGVVWEAAV